jgi:hypothetical protein
MKDIIILREEGLEDLVTLGEEDWKRSTIIVDNNLLLISLRFYTEDKKEYSKCMIVMILV